MSSPSFYRLPIELIITITEIIGRDRDSDQACRTLFQFALVCKRTRDPAQQVLCAMMGYTRKALNTLSRHPNWILRELTSSPESRLNMLRSHLTVLILVFDLALLDRPVTTAHQLRAIYVEMGNAICSLRKLRFLSVNLICLHDRNSINVSTISVLRGAVFQLEYLYWAGQICDQQRLVHDILPEQKQLGELALYWHYPLAYVLAPAQPRPPFSKTAHIDTLSGSFHHLVDMIVASPSLRCLFIQEDECDGPSHLDWQPYSPLLAQALGKLEYLAFSLPEHKFLLDFCSNSLVISIPYSCCSTTMLSRFTRLRVLIIETVTDVGDGLMKESASALFTSHPTVIHIEFTHLYSGTRRFSCDREQLGMTIARCGTMSAHQKRAVRYAYLQIAEQAHVDAQFPLCEVKSSYVDHWIERVGM